MAETIYLTPEQAEQYLASITSIEAAEKRIKALRESGLGFKELAPFIDSVTKKLGLTTEQADKLTNSLVGAGQGFQDFAANFSDSSTVQKYLKIAESGFEKLKNKIGDTNLTNSGFAKKLGAVTLGMKFTNVPEHFKDIGASARDMQAQLSDSSSVIGGLSKIFKGVGLDIPEETIKKYAEYMDATRNMQRGMIMNAASTGNLTEFFDGNAVSLDYLNNKTANYNNTVTKIRLSTGMTSEQTAKYYNILNKIPGAAKSTSDGINIAGKNFQFLTAASFVAAGAGQTLDQVLQDLNFSAETLGLSGADALGFINKIANAADALDLQPEKMREFAQTAASSFAMLGDNSNAVINIMGKVGPALQKAGVAPKQLFDIMTHVTTQMSEMTTAQKAFLSASTGGPGGLQGAFQIENMMAEGKVDEVFDKLQTNLRERMGGQLVTSKQAEQSPELAAKAQQQRMMLQSSAFGGLAKNDQMARVLSDAMANNDFKTFAEGMNPTITVEDKDKALADTVEKGNQISQLGNSALFNIEAYAAKFAGMQANALNDYRAKADGSKNEVARRSFREANEDAGKVARFNPITGTGNQSGNRSPDFDFENMGADIKKSLMRVPSIQGGVNAVKNVFQTPPQPKMEMPKFESLPLTQPQSPQRRSIEMVDTIDRARAEMKKDKVQAPQDVNVNVNVKNELAITCPKCQEKTTADQIKQYHTHEVNAVF